MATLREQLCGMRQTAFFDPTLSPRAEDVTLLVGKPPVEQSATVLICERLGRTTRDDASGVQATANSATVVISKAEVDGLPQIHDGYRGSLTTATGDQWSLLDIAYQDDAFWRVQARRTVVAGAGKHRAMPWGG